MIDWLSGAITNERCLRWQKVVERERVIECCGCAAAHCPRFRVAEQTDRAGILPAVSLTFSRQTALFCWLSRDRFCVSASFKLQQTSEAAWLTTWFHSYQSWYEWNRVKSSFPRVSLCRGRIPARWWLPCLFWWQFNQLTEQMQADASTRDRGETRMADVELLHNNTYRQI